MPDAQAIQAEVDEIYATELTDQPPHTPTQVEACKQVIKLFLTCFKYNQYDDVRKLVAEDYKQHNVTLGTGSESIIEFAEQNRNPDGTSRMKLSYKRILVDGEYVIVHIQGNLGQEAFKVVDIFRYRNGVFIEHWDSAEPIPAKDEWKNANGPF